MAARATLPTPPYSLAVRVGPAGDPYWEVRWRHRQPDGTLRDMKRRLAPAHVERDAGGDWQRPRSRPRVPEPGQDPAIDDRDAAVAAPELVRAVTDDLRRREAGENPDVTFREVAHDYLEWLADIRDARPSTLNDYRSRLAEPGTPHKRGKGTCSGHIMAALGDRPAAEITTREINQVLRTISKTGVSVRTVERARALLHAVYVHAMKPATYELLKNPVKHADRRKLPQRDTLNYYSPEEVEALARALHDGLHRDPGDPRGIDEDEQRWRRLEDTQDGEIVRVAAYAGLRRGELMALRWRDIDFTGRKITVRSTMSGGVEMASTKSRRVREVPLARQAAAALDRLSRREDFTQPTDYVFCSRVGERLDGSAVYRRFVRARDRAGLRPLRFHDLRHSFGSLLVAAGMDLPQVQAAMGHSTITTTSRYLHARPAVELADRFSAAFDSATPDVPETAAVADA